MLTFTFEECGLFELILLQNSEYIKNNGNFNGDGNAEKAKLLQNFKTFLGKKDTQTGFEVGTLEFIRVKFIVILIP